MRGGIVIATSRTGASGNGPILTSTLNPEQAIEGPEQAIETRNG